MNTRDILARLIGFATVSRDSNLELIEFVRDFLAGQGVIAQVFRNSAGTKANLYATIGPTDRGGVLLSGHTDVVPVDGQTWSADPFCMIERNGRLYGRGAADMKGFLAAALGAAGRASRRDLRVPLHLAFSYDEEVGCLGVRSLIAAMATWTHRPRLCIVGEPTLLTLGVGHKGKTALRAICCGQPAHSAFPGQGVNAIYLATELIQRMRERQVQIEESRRRDPGYDVPYTTLHVGVIRGGVTLNIVPDRCEFELEIRNLAADDPAVVVSALQQDAAQIAAASRRPGALSDIRLEVINEYPGLETPADSEVVRLVAALTGSQERVKVAFGTEAGLFSGRLGIPSVVCGPGCIDQAHKADEFVSLDQLARCDAMMDALIEHLT